VNPKAKIIFTVLLGLASLSTVVFGGRLLLTYQNSPGKVDHVSSAWPANSSVQLATDRPTLVMIAHPKCPCTRASIAELAQVMARVPGKVRSYVLFYTPPESGADWQNTDLRCSAAQIPGVTVLSDIDGAEAQHFGAETSGHIFLFDPSGRLLFNGGITASRGHAGDNAGESSLVSLIDNQTSKLTRTFVFGCALKNQTAKGAKCLK
jgi:hypothetical protein